MLSLLISTVLGSLLPGQTTSLTFTLAGGTSASEIQWDFAHVGLNAAPAVIGAAATAASKSLSQSGDRILIAGINQTLMAPGVLATMDITVPVGAPAGNVVISLSNVVASDADGGNVPVTVGFPLTIIILPASVASVLAVPATSTSGMLPPVIHGAVNVLVVAATSASGMLAPTVTGTGGSLGPNANVLAVPATSTSGMLPPSLQLGANVVAVPATSSSGMLAPAVSGGPTPPTTPGGPPGLIRTGHTPPGHATLFR